MPCLLQESFIKTRNCSRKNGKLFQSSSCDVFIPIRYKYYFKQNLKKLNYNNLKKHFSVLFLFWDCLI